MQRLILLEIAPTMADSIWEARNEFIDAGEKKIYGSGGLQHATDAEDYFDMLQEIAKDPKRFPATQYVSVDAAMRLVGFIALRTPPTDGSMTEEEIEKLLREIGHIGYSILPSRRGSGYGKEQLSLALEKAEEKGLSRAIVIANETNLASINTIKSNGGVLIDKGWNDITKEVTETYAIYLSERS